MLLCPILDQPLLVKTISANTNNYNQRTDHGSPGYPVRARTIINGSVIVGSTSTANPSYDTGSGWVAGSICEIVITGDIYGMGGAGGRGGNATYLVSAENGVAGSDGGPALKAQVKTLITNNGSVRGAGGGGGGSGGTWGNAGVGGGSGGGGGRGSSGGSAGGAGTGTPLDESQTGFNGNPGGGGSSSAAGGGGGGYTVLGGNMVVGAGGAGGDWATGGGTGNGSATVSHSADTNGGGGGGAGNCTTSGSSAFITWLVTGTRSGTLG